MTQTNNPANGLQAVQDVCEIQQLIQRERQARDFGMWAVMAACYAPDARIEISWFNGNADDFVAASRKIAETGTRSLHQMAPTLVTVNGAKAITDTGCEIHVMTVLDGTEMIVSSQARLLSRAVRTDSGWRMASFRTLYVWDTLAAVRPSAAPDLDADELAALRPSYRHLAYVMKRRGHTFPDDLPGVDKPDGERLLRDKEVVWLNET